MHLTVKQHNRHFSNNNIENSLRIAQMIISKVKHTTPRSDRNATKVSKNNRIHSFTKFIFRCCGNIVHRRVHVLTHLKEMKIHSPIQVESLVNGVVRR